MPTLALKLVLTPALIAAASLAGRRWGPSVSGWFVALPFTSGPVAFFLALAHGTAYAATAATGTLSGTFSEGAFCLAYAWLAVHLCSRRGPWLAAVAAGALAFAAATGLLASFPLPLAPLIPLAFAVLLLALWLMPSGHSSESDGVAGVPGVPADAIAHGGMPQQRLPVRANAQPIPTRAPRQRHDPAAPTETKAANLPRWDLPLRMAVATAFVVLLTALAPILGARLTGLLATFPLFASVLAVFAHMQHGPAAATDVLRGLLLGLFAFAGFFSVLALLLVPAGIALAFCVALGAALCIQGGSLWLLQRRAR